MGKRAGMPDASGGRSPRKREASGLTGTLTSGRMRSMSVAIERWVQVTGVLE